ncbi:MAG: FliH/SctL family protein [Nitrospinaceae bacterium]
MYKNPKTFIRSYQAVESPEPSPGEPSREQVRDFELLELVSQNKGKGGGFVYDSEEATNFDAKKIQKAKQGVKEILADAIQKAKRQAIEIKEQAEKEARKTGYEEGFKKGELDAKEEFRPLLETLQNTIRDLSGFRKKMYSKVEREMVEMVISLVKKVIEFELSTREDSVQEMIKLAVQSVLDKESMTIKINPVDKEYAENFRPELQRQFGEIKNITFEPHSGIERGGCIIETNFGTVDARMDKLSGQIDKILHLTPPPPEEPPKQNPGS